jgi:hypothetical protein
MTGQPEGSEKLLLVHAAAISCRANEAAHRWTYNLGPTSVSVVNEFTVDGSDPHWLVIAATPVSEDDVFDGSAAVVPPEARRLAEQAIEVGAVELEPLALNDRRPDV